MAGTKVRLENRSAHLKYITVGNGQSIAVPPQEQGGVDVAFDSEAELVAFRRALETPTVREWISSGELVVAQDGGSPKPAAPTSPDAKTRRGGREGE